MQSTSEAESPTDPRYLPGKLGQRQQSGSKVAGGGRGQRTGQEEERHSSKSVLVFDRGREGRGQGGQGWQGRGEMRDFRGGVHDVREHTDRRGEPVQETVVPGVERDPIFPAAHARERRAEFVLQNRAEQTSARVAVIEGSRVETTHRTSKHEAVVEASLDARPSTPSAAHAGGRGDRRHATASTGPEDPR